jgi:hypothetical protein
MQTRCLCVWNPRVWIQTSLGSLGEAFCSSPGVQRGLPGLLICSFYLLFRLGGMTARNCLMGRFLISSLGIFKEVDGGSRTLLPYSLFLTL